MLNDPRSYFSEFGYFIIKEAFHPATVPLLCDELVRIHSEFPELKSKFPLMHRLGEWSIRSPHLGSQLITDFIYSNHFAGICRSFLDEDADLYWSATAAKPKEKGKGFPWHQDAGYGGPEEYITFWAAFDRVDEENGCLWAVPGSHKEGILCHELRKSDEMNYGGPFIKGPCQRVQDTIPIRLSPGDVVCMHSKLVHASFQNQSSRERRGLITAFIKPGYRRLDQIVGTPEITVPFIRSGQLVIT